MKFLKKYIYLILVCCFMSFSLMRDLGNQNGCPTYSMANTDGVFTVYNVTQDFNFGQPAVDFKKYVGYFLQTRGDTASRVASGNLSFSNELLTFISGSNYYIDDDNVNNGNGNKKWVNSGSSGHPSFNYHFTRGLAEVDIKDQYEINDSVKVQDGLNIDLSKVKNADSVIVTITGFNGITINKRYNGLVQSSNFTASELSGFITGGIISVSAFNIFPETIGNKNYLFSSVHQYLKIVYFKNQ